jgi:SAM-dependent methyltransferase
MRTTFTRTDACRLTPAEYDAWYETDRGRWIGEAEHRLLVELLSPSAGERVLDVGCGTGWFTRRSSAMAGLRVTGVDIDAAALAFARERDPRTSYGRADAVRLPFDDGSFERVMSVTTLCFVPDWSRALAEIVRVSRVRFVVGLLNRTSLLRLDKGRDGGRGAYRGAHWHARAEIVAALAGLPVAKLRFRTAVLLAGGTPLARLVEPWLGQRTPFGSFLVVAGDKAPGAARSSRRYGRSGELPCESSPPFGSTTRTFSPVPAVASHSSTRPFMRSATARTIDSPSPEPICPVPGTR